MAAPLRTARGAVLLVLTMSLALVGCSADDPNITPTRTTTAPTTAPPPSPEELAADAAVMAFTEMREVMNAASQDPGARDWEPDIRQYAGDPAAYAAVQSIREYVTLGIRQEGASTVEAEVSSVDLASLEGPTVLITACYDHSESPLVRADTGAPIRPPGAPAELPRFVWNVKVIQYQAEPGAPWLVSMIDPHPDQAC